VTRCAKAYALRRSLGIGTAQKNRQVQADPESLQADPESLGRPRVPKEMGIALNRVAADHRRMREKNTGSTVRRVL
jgi:hypothetical protein